MDEPIVLILLMLFMAVIFSAVVLPIIALVISIRSRNRVNQQLARLAQTPPAPGASQQRPISDRALFGGAIQQLDARLKNLEAALTAHSIPIPKVVETPSQPATPPTPEPVSIALIWKTITTEGTVSPFSGEGSTRTEKLNRRALRFEVTGATISIGSPA